MKIALAGNPNSGKTTLYNRLTGRNEKVGNWAGVTVEGKEHPVKKSLSSGERITVVDLPGAYSMSPFTNEESITRNYILNESPDVIINIVDVTNLSRGLFFTTQLLEQGIPVVVALNKTDLMGRNHTEINTALLAQKLGCPVVETVSTRSRGIENILKAAKASLGKGQVPPYCSELADRISEKESSLDDRKRFEFVKEVVEAVEVKSSARVRRFCDRLDDILLNAWLGIPMFALVMLLVFQISQTWLGAWIAEGFSIGGNQIPGLVTLLEIFQAFIAGLLQDANPLLTALLVDGIIGGVVAVVGFLPLVMVLYFLIALLEDCGYMSRVAALLDPVFKKVGLSGRSVIPFVITIGCAVPGIMAARTIRDERERRATAMLAPFMPCGAKIPVIALFAGAFFDGAGWVSGLVYLVGILLIFLGALLVNQIAGVRRKSGFFIVEFPEYKRPSLWSAFKTMCGRGKEYIVKAATIILLCNTAVQVMQTFDWSFSVSSSADSSILATLAAPFAYALIPVVGVFSWQLAAAAVTGFIAKENVVGTLAVCFVGLENLIDTEELSLIDGAGGSVAGVMAISKVAALAYLMFNLYTPPCFAAIGAMNSEMNSRKWLFGGIALQLGVGYTVSYLVYTVGTLMTAPETLNIAATLAGLAAVLGFAAVAVVLAKHSRLKEAV